MPMLFLAWLANSLASTISLPDHRAIDHPALAGGQHVPLPARVFEPDQFGQAAGERDQVGAAIVIEIGGHHLIAALRSVAMVCSMKAPAARRPAGGGRAAERADGARSTVYLLLTAMKKTVVAGDGGVPAAARRQATHLSGSPQLTHGGQNAEAYWSPDGKRLIFQTTRPPYECDQMFVMNADGSDQHLVSTGKGRTTCGYFLADSKHIVYGSTHLAGDACPAPPDRSKGYVWGVFPVTIFSRPRTPARSRSA